MKFGIYLLIVVLLYGVWKTHRTVQRSQSSEERFFAIRASAFTWLVSFGLLVGFLFLPGKQRIVFLLPAFLIVSSLLRLWRNGRERLRREQEQAQVDIERMKRVN